MHFVKNTLHPLYTSYFNNFLFLKILQFLFRSVFRNKLIIKSNYFLGADVSLVGSMVFLAQFSLSLFMGSLIKLIDSNTIVVYSASAFALCGAITANFLLYLD